MNAVNPGNITPVAFYFMGFPRRFGDKKNDGGRYAFGAERMVCMVLSSQACVMWAAILAGIAVFILECVMRGDDLPPLRMLSGGAGRVAPAGGGVRMLPKRAHSFYHSPEWRALCADLIAKRGALCVRCGRGGKGVTIYADHIVEIKDGGARLDPMNVQLLCGRCHAGKTAKARAARHGTGGVKSSEGPRGA